MKPNSQLSYPDAEQHFSFEINMSQTMSLPAFRSDDVVLMNAARDEEEWLAIAQACKQSGTRLVVAASIESAAQLTDRIREEQVTVLMTTARQWTSIYNQLNKAPGLITRLKVVLMDTPQAPEQRYALIPRALSKAKIENTYEAYQKAPWIQARKQSQF